MRTMRRPRRALGWVAVAAATAGLALAALLLRRERDAPPVRPRSDPASIAAAPALVPPGAVAVPAIVEVAREPAAAAPQPAPGAGDSSPLIVEVIARATGAAVPGAEVFVAEPTAQDRAFDRHRFSPTLPEEQGHRFVADAAGRVELAVPPPYGVVAARHGSEFGRAEHSGERNEPRAPDSRILQVPIEPDRALEIRVAYAAGRPCAELAFDLYVRSGPSRDLPVWSARTAGPKATAVLPHARALFRSLELLGGPTQPNVELLPRLPLAPGALVPTQLSAADVERGEVAILLPSGAPLELVAETADGSRFDGPLLYFVAAAASGGSYRGEQVRAEAGIARLAWVPARARLAVAAVPCDRSFLPGEIEFAGPDGPGGVVEARVRLGAPNPAPPGELADRPVFRVRVLDAAGAPLARERVSWAVECGDSNRDFGYCDADEQGRARIELGRSIAPRVRATLTVQAGDCSPSRFDVTGQALPGVVDLGEAACTSAAIAIDGVVVDRSGAPLPGVRVTARDQWSGSERDATTDAAGGFAIAAAGAGGSQWLRAEFGDAAPSGTIVAPRASGVRLVLDTGAVRGRVVAPAGVALGGMQVVLRNERHWASARVEDDGRFLIRSVKPGHYTLAVYPPDDPDPLARLAGVDVDSSGNAADLRLAAIDIAAAVAFVTLTVTDEHGAPLSGVTIESLRIPRAVALTDFAGRAKFLRYARPLLLRAQAEGRAPGLWDGVAEDREIALLPRRGP